MNHAAAEMIVRDKKFRGDCRRICKDPQFVPDLIQEVALKVLSMPEEKVSNLVAQNRLFFYAGRIAVNLNNDRYRKQIPTYDSESIEIEENELTEDIEYAYELLEEPVTQGNEKAWYEWAVFSLWVKLDYCVLCVTKETNIGKTEVRRVVEVMKMRYRIRLFLQSKLREA